MSDQAQAQAQELDVCLRIKHVVAMTALSKSTIYRLMSAGDFPKSIKLTPYCIVWRKSAVQEWIKQREQQS